MDRTFFSIWMRYLTLHFPRILNGTPWLKYTAETPFRFSVVASVCTAVLSASQLIIPNSCHKISEKTLLTFPAVSKEKQVAFLLRLCVRCWPIVINLFNVLFLPWILRLEHLHHIIYQPRGRHIRGLPQYHKQPHGLFNYSSFVHNELVTLDLRSFGMLSSAYL